MKQFFKMFFASFLAIVIAWVIFFSIIIGMIVGASKSISSDEGSAISENSVLLIETEDVIHELGQTNSLAALSGKRAGTPGLYDILQAIEYAKTDKSIKGIFIRIGESPNGWATMQQLRNALVSFKESKKFIYAYGEVIPQKAYYLASVADSIFINPMGFTEFKGLSSELPFFKGTLQKLELQPEIFYAGKFKSATEPFREEKMSEPNRRQISELQADFWSEFLAAVSEHTKSSAEELHNLAVTGEVMFPGDALRHKLVDALYYADQVEELLKKKTGRKEDEKVKFAEMDDYASHARKKRKVSQSRIAVLVAEGSISDGEKNDEFEIASKDFVEEIRKVRKNEKIKAVVLRVNSPGGSALASEVILRELQLLQEKKPLIVSMGDVAASGGYYISCAADSIFALPTTITGSIGVFTMLFNTEKLLKNKLGVTFDTVKNAPYADFPSVTRPLNVSESQKMQATVDTIYSVFKRRVANGRKLDVGYVDSIAQGRVWTGTDALANGLVDRLGGLDVAIKSAAAKAGVKDYYVVTYPEPVDKFEAFMRRFKGADLDAETVKAAMESEMGAQFRFYKQIKTLQNMHGKAQMAMPFEVKVQ